jgi:type II secretory pathway pseudopilin PulG
MKTYSGFTLLELATVLAILTITVIGIPPMMQWLNRQGVRHAVDQLNGDLQLARVMAIRQKQTCAVTFNQPGPNQYVNSINQKIVDLSSYRGGVHFMSRGPTDDAMSLRICFTSRGMTVPAADIYLANGGRQDIYRLRVLVPGGISIFRWDGDHWK